jgi:hypothetical protein
LAVFDLPSTNSAKTRVKRFIGQVQERLLDAAQQEWLAKRGAWAIRWRNPRLL